MLTGPSQAAAAGDPDETTVSVVVADDHPMWREAVARDLTEAGFEVLATADEGYSAVTRTLEASPDVLVLDLNLPGLRGDQVCAAIMKAQIPTRVLILSASAEQGDVLGAVSFGATGYLLKTCSRQELLDAVRATAQGRAVFTPGLAGLVLGEFRRLAADSRREDVREVPELSVREIEVLKLVATGMSYKQIGVHLFISHRTVQNHVQNTLKKLQLHNRIELVRFAIVKGLAT